MHQNINSCLIPLRNDGNYQVSLRVLIVLGFIHLRLTRGLRRSLLIILGARQLVEWIKFLKKISESARLKSNHLFQCLRLNLSKRRPSLNIGENSRHVLKNINYQHLQPQPKQIDLAQSTLISFSSETKKS